MSPLILTGISLEPIIVKISDTTFGLVKDSQLIVMSTAADNTNGEQIIELDDTPYSVGESLTLWECPNGQNTSWTFRIILCWFHSVRRAVLIDRLWQRVTCTDRRAVRRQLRLSPGNNDQFKDPKNVRQQKRFDLRYVGNEHLVFKARPTRRTNWATSRRKTFSAGSEIGRKLSRECSEYIFL